LDSFAGATCAKAATVRANARERIVIVRFIGISLSISWVRGDAGLRVKCDYAAASIAEMQGDF
jgi:hypothetical protein